jgi:hypothetical protein
MANGLAREVTPTLIAAVGGTGMAAAKHLKARLEEMRGPKRPFIAIRAFDTDYQDARAPLLVSNSEHVYLGGFNAQNVIQDIIDGRGFPHYAAWLPPWLSFQQVANGAGGIRPIGRLCYFYQRAKIQSAAQEALRSITDGETALRYFQESGTRVNLDAGVDIHVIGSLCGGTGAGMFLDLAYDLRRWARSLTTKQVTMTGHFVLPEAFRNKQVVMRSLEANCYASLQELDFFMNSSGDSAWRVEYDQGHPLESRHLPFDYCYLLSGLQQGGLIDIDGLSAIIGEATFLLTNTEVGQRILAGAINTNSQNKTTRDERGRACCYSSYGVLSLEIPHELLGQSLGATLASAARDQLLEPVAARDLEVEPRIGTLILNMKLTLDEIEQAMPKPALDLAPILYVRERGGGQTTANAALIKRLVDAHASVLREAKQRGARQAAGVTDLNREIHDELALILPRPGGFERSKAFLEGLLGRLRTFQTALTDRAGNAQARASELRSAAETIERQGVDDVTQWATAGKPWVAFVEAEAAHLIYQGQALLAGRLVDAVSRAMEKWDRIRVLFTDLRLETAIDADAYYRAHRARTSACPISWFEARLVSQRDDMIQDTLQRLLTGLADEFDEGKDIVAADLSGRLQELCTDAMRDYFSGQPGMTCERLLSDGHPGDSYQEVVSVLCGRAQASWELNETYPLRTNVIEISSVGATANSRLGQRLAESGPKMTFVGNSWPDYLPIMRTEHGLSLIGLKRLADYRRSFGEAISIEQRYDLHFFLDCRWVSELPFPDDDQEELEQLRCFTLSEKVGMLRRPAAKAPYTFEGNGTPPTKLEYFRYASFERFRVMSELFDTARRHVTPLLSDPDQLAAWVKVLRGKIEQARLATARSTSALIERPIGRDVHQVHQEIRSVRAAMGGGEERL